MKKTNLFFLAAFLTASHLLVAQNTSTEKERETETITSPLMMFGGEQKATPAGEHTDPRQIRGEREESANDADSSSLAVRGTLSGLSEKEGNKNGQKSHFFNQQEVTLDHFRDALEFYPHAERFVIAENEGHPIQPEKLLVNKELARSNNLAIINALRDAVEREYSSVGGEIVNEVLRKNSELNAATLQQILTLIDTKAELGERGDENSREIITDENDPEHWTSRLHKAARLLSEHARENLEVEAMPGGAKDKDSLDERISAARES